MRTGRSPSSPCCAAPMQHTCMEAVPCLCWRARCATLPLHGQPLAGHTGEQMPIVHWAHAQHPECALTVNRLQQGTSDLGGQHSNVGGCPPDRRLPFCTCMGCPGPSAQVQVWVAVPVAQGPCHWPEYR